MKTKIAIMFGGKNTEHEGSIESALHVFNSIDNEKYDIHAVYIKKDGEIATPQELIDQLDSFLDNSLIKIIPSLDNTEEFIENMKKFSVFSGNENKDKIDFYDNMLKKKYDVVFPIFHGINGEDGTVQGMVQFLGIPCVGCGVEGSVTGIDKEITKLICKANKIRVADFISLWEYELDDLDEAYIRKIEKKIKYPMFIKPSRLGSSIGISRVDRRDQFMDAVKNAFKYDSKILIEKGIDNHREFAVCLSGYGKNIEVAEIGEFKSSRSDFFDYEAKYGSSSLDGVIPAEISPKVKKKLEKLCKKAFKVLGLKGFSRIDCFYANEKLYLNEVNTIPGLEAHGTFSKTWLASGVPREEFFNRVIEGAIKDFKKEISKETSLSLDLELE